MAEEEVDYREKYSDMQKEMWEWRDKYLQATLDAKRQAKRTMLVVAATGALGIAAGYVLRLGR